MEAKTFLRFFPKLIPNNKGRHGDSTFILYITFD